MKICKACGVEKEINDFYVSSEGYRNVKCRQCETKRKLKQKGENRIETNNRERLRDIKKREENRKLIDNYRRSHPCSRCGEADIRCLDFHHLDPTQKKYNFGRLRKKGYATQTILNEIEKCIILCSNCHRKEWVAEFY